MDNLWILYISILVILFLIYQVLRKILNKMENTEDKLSDIEQHLKNINADVSDLDGKANFKWGFSEHYPGEK